MLAVRIVPGKAACEGGRKNLRQFHEKQTLGKFFRKLLARGEQTNGLKFKQTSLLISIFFARDILLITYIRETTNPDPSFEENLQGVKWAPRAVKDIDWLLSGNNIVRPKAVESVPLSADTQYNPQFSFTSIFFAWQSISLITFSNAINIFVVY